MKPYCKNEKPFVYTVFTGHDSEQAFSVMKKMNEEGIAFWFSNTFSKKEVKRMEAAYSCIIFISNNSIHDEKVRRSIKFAVRFNKKILCIYLEPTSLTPGLELLLNSLQSIDKAGFADEQVFLDKLISADVFSGMHITDAQKRFAKRRALASVFIPIVSAVVIFFAVVVPLLIAPMVLAANGSLSKVGFGNLSLAELAKVEKLNVVGMQSIDPWCYSLYADETKQEVFANEIGDVVRAGDISDISDLTLLKNVKEMTFSANQVSDISPLYKLKTLEWLALNCNPIKSIEGIETLQNLITVSISDTEVSDISPLFKIPSLKYISFEKTYVNSIEGIEELPQFLGFNASQSNLTDISPLNNIDFSYITDTEGFSFGAEATPIEDYSPLQRIPKFYHILVSVRHAEDILPYIRNKQVNWISLWGSDIGTVDALSSIQSLQDLHLRDSYQLVSLNGIEEHDSLNEIYLQGCLGITDFTPLLELPKLESLVLSQDMKALVGYQLDGAAFEILYEE